MLSERAAQPPRGAGLGEGRAQLLRRLHALEQGRAGGLCALGPGSDHRRGGVQLGGEGLRGVAAAHRVAGHGRRRGLGGGGGVGQRGEGDVAGRLAAG